MRPAEHPENAGPHQSDAAAATAAPGHRPTPRAPAIALFLLLAVVQAIWIARSDGFYYIDDSCLYNLDRGFFAHYLHEPISTWARLGRSFLFAVPAQFGPRGPQILGALLLLATTWVACGVLAVKGVRHAHWAIPLIGFQPALFNISYTSLAELPAAFLITLAYLLHLRGRWAWAMTVASLIFTFRTEYSYVAILFLIPCLARRRWFALPLLLVGPILWHLHTWGTTGDPTRFFRDLTLHSRLPRITEGIAPEFYLWRAPQIYGIVQVALFLFALLTLARRRALLRWAIPLLIVAGGIAGHTLAAMKGLHLTCSTGQLRYVAVVGPMVGLVAMPGLARLLDAARPGAIATLSRCALLALLFFTGPFLTPFHVKLQVEWICESLVRLCDRLYPDHKILTDLHYVANLLDEPKDADHRSAPLTARNIARHDRAILIWFERLEGSPFGLPTATRREIESDPRIRLIYHRQESVPHDPDVPGYLLYPDAPPWLKAFLDYHLMDHYDNERIHLRVYLKG